MSFFSVSFFFLSLWFSFFLVLFSFSGCGFLCQAVVFGLVLSALSGGVALLVLWFCPCLFRAGSLETLFFCPDGFGVSALLF